MRQYKYLTLFLAGAFTYGLMEIIWRGCTHWTMLILGGALFLALGSFNELIEWEMPLCYQSLFGALLITLLEFLAGVVLNIWLELDIWDYSHLPFNLIGQICVGYFLLWIPVSCFAIVLDDILRYLWWDEEKPHYVMFGKL